MAKQTSTEDEKTKIVLLLDTFADKLTQNVKDIILMNINDNVMWLKSDKFADISTFLNDFVRKLDDVENQLRLPKTSVPERYRLHIDASNVHKGEKGFSGEVEIDAKITELTDYIMIHSRSQEIVELKVFNRDDNTEIAILDYHQHPPADTLTIYFWESLSPDTEITIHVKYLATMLTYEAGFYQTYYVFETEKRFLGATQFQAADARFAFPCYDEPALKAIFELKITHTKTYDAISNSIGERVEKWVEIRHYKVHKLTINYFLAVKKLQQLFHLLYRCLPISLLLLFRTSNTSKTHRQLVKLYTGSGFDQTRYQKLNMRWSNRLIF
jgi:Peptidase M1 N-terminal domain